MKCLLIFVLVWSGLEASFATNPVLTKTSSFMMQGRPFYWQGKTHNNHFYYDFNGDKVIDAMDVFHAKGVDFYGQRENKVYYRKIQILRTNEGGELIWLSRVNNQWVKKLQKKITTAQFKEISTISSNANYDLPFSLGVVKGLSCLGKNEQTSYLVQKIVSQIVHDDSKCLADSDKCKKLKNDNLEYKTHKSKADDKQIFYDLLISLGFEDEIKKSDLAHACTECCLGYNGVACRLCFSNEKTTLLQNNLQHNDEQNREYDLLALFLYDDRIDAHKKTSKYHDALERVHAKMSDPLLVRKLLDFFDGKKDKLLETLYFQFTAHMNKNVNSLSNVELYYSDMIAELMSKVSCFDENHKQKDEKNEDKKKCEVM